MLVLIRSQAALPQQLKRPYQSEWELVRSYAFCAGAFTGFMWLGSRALGHVAPHQAIWSGAI